MATEVKTTVPGNMWKVLVKEGEMVKFSDVEIVGIPNKCYVSEKYDSKTKELTLYNGEITNSKTRKPIKPCDMLMSQLKSIPDYLKSGIKGAPKFSIKSKAYNIGEEPDQILSEMVDIRDIERNIIKDNTVLNSLYKMLTIPNIDVDNFKNKIKLAATRLTEGMPRWKIRQLALLGGKKRRQTKRIRRTKKIRPVIRRKRTKKIKPTKRRR